MQGHCTHCQAHVVLEEHDWDLLVALRSADSLEPLLYVLAAAASRSKEVHNDEDPTTGSIVNDELKFLLALYLSHTICWAYLQQRVDEPAEAR